MSEKISSGIQAVVSKEQHYPVLFVKSDLSRVSYFRSLMEECQDSYSLKPCGKSASLPCGEETAKAWKKDGSSTVDCYSKNPRGNDKNNEEEKTNWKEKEKNQCLPPFFVTGANGEFFLHPGFKPNERARDEEIKEVSSMVQSSFRQEPELSATVDCARGGKETTEGSASLSTKGMLNLMQCELQELVGKSVSHMEIQGDHSLSIQPRSDKLQKTSIEMQKLPNGDFLIRIVTSSKEALAVIQTHLSMIHSRFSEVFPFRPLQLKLKYSRDLSTEELLREKGMLVPIRKMRHEGAV
jgi:hypothetical protein